MTHLSRRFACVAPWREGASFQYDANGDPISQSYNGRALPRRMVRRIEGGRGGVRVRGTCTLVVLGTLA